MDAPTSDEAPGLHVLHVVPGPLFGRLGHLFRQLGFALGNEGMRVSLLTDDLRSSLAFDGTPIIDYFVPALSGWRGWRTPRELDALFPRRPDVVHIWGHEPFALVARWASTRGAAVCVSLTGENDLRRLRRVARGRQTLRVVAPHEQLAGRWEAGGGTAHVVPPGLLPPTATTPLLTPDRTVGILSVGRSAERRGAAVLLNAIARLRESGADIQVAMVCMGGSAQAIWQLVRALKIKDVVSLTDAADAWIEAIGGCDVFVAPSVERELTLAPLAAMAFQRLVVASDDQPGDWFADEETCLTFPAGDAEALARALRRAVDRFPTVRAIARSAGRFVARHHSISQMAARLCEVYRGRAPAAVAADGGGAT